MTDDELIAAVKAALEKELEMPEDLAEHLFQITEAVREINALNIPEHVKEAAIQARHRVHVRR